MTLYIRNQPIGTDDLDVSQPILQNNGNAADSVFGFEHYAFSNQTANQGLHNTVTTPTYIDFPSSTPSANPPITSTEPIFYGFTPGGGTPSTNLPIIQWSRGVMNAVPTPLTTIQSTQAGVTIGIGATINIFDFSGMNIAYANVYAMTTSGSFVSNATISATVFFNGTSLVGAFGTNPLSLASNGAKILQLKNNTANPFTGTVFWTIEFIRIQ